MVTSLEESPQPLLNKSFDQEFINSSFSENVTYLEDLQEEQMTKLTNSAQKNIKNQTEWSKFYNLSLKELFANSVKTLSLIFKDVISMNFYSSSSFFKIFLKDDRALYLGFFLVFAALMVALFLTLFYKS